MYSDPLLLCLQDISFPLLPPSVLQSREHLTEQKCKYGFCSAFAFFALCSGQQSWGLAEKSGWVRTKLNCHQYLWILMKKLLVLVKGIFRGVCEEKEELSTMEKIRSAVLSHR